MTSAARVITLDESDYGGPSKLHTALLAPVALLNTPEQAGKVAEDEGVEPLAFTPPRFSGPVASLPSGILRGMAEGIGIEPMRRYSDRRLASEYLTARSTLRVYREVLDDER